MWEKGQETAETTRCFSWAAGHWGIILAVLVSAPYKARTDTAWRAVKHEGKGLHRHSAVSESSLEPHRYYINNNKNGTVN